MIVLCRKLRDSALADISNASEFDEVTLPSPADVDLAMVWVCVSLCWGVVRRVLLRIPRQCCVKVEDNRGMDRDKVREKEKQTEGSRWLLK